MALGTCGFLATSDTKLTLVAQDQVYKSLRCLLLGEKAPQGQIGVHAHTSQSEGTGAEQQYCLLQSLWETRQCRTTCGDALWPRGRQLNTYRNGSLLGSTVTLTLVAVFAGGPRKQGQGKGLTSLSPFYTFS